jgi:predicted ATPase/signal transduction histidine kinase
VKRKNPDYEFLVPLCTDERFELLRGRRIHTGASVLLKRSSHTPPGPADLTLLQRECAIASELTSAATLLPRSVGSGHHVGLVMEDPGGELLSAVLTRGKLPPEAVLAVGAQVAETLAELHGRGIIHNGIRPAAVLFEADSLHAWLVDFSHTSHAGVRYATPTFVAGESSRLTYISPEQTGRMEGVADPRSDLYALGVVLYELLTGVPPFRSEDMLEQIHWHIAGTAPDPCELDTTIPAVLSEVIMRLLAKTPAERYQSASGLARDLAQCTSQWAAGRQIKAFVLGRRDGAEHLVISSKLYGREREVHTLLEAFDQACLGRGGGTMLLVEGYSGVGKTSLIQQLWRPIVRQKGYFISGKFDQVVRGGPFGALIQGFLGLVRQILTESEPQLALWRNTLSSALGVNGGVLAAVIPEIEFIIGPQPAPTVLEPVEAQNRFERVLLNFLGALAQPGHPLVLFLDDLQWADAATLNLLEPLLSGTDIGCLMLMGAYRDNELDASPRLARTLAALGAAGIALQRISLGPLRLPDLTQLLADTLLSSAEQAAPLAQLVLEKTDGNPFFVTQLLKVLEREGHLHFDVDAACWTYEVERIADAPLADNVVELMTRSIQRLPAKSQYALTLAACIGNRFDRQTLAIISEQSVSATADDLEQALAEGLIVNAVRRFGDGVDAADEDAETFAFLHDRVQQSAYAMIPIEWRQMVHLKVGRLLRSRGTVQQLGSGLFDIVHHLNLGRSLIHVAAERRELAALNLAAGRRAQLSTARDTALELFEAGRDLLDLSAWTHDYDLCFDLHLEAAQGQYLCGHFDAALRALTEAVGLARTPVDRARALRLLSVQHENMARYGEALAIAREGLALFDVAFPDAEGDKAAALEDEVAAIESLRDGREIAALMDLPTMADPQIRMVMTMLTDIWSAAYLTGDSTLARLISATLVRLSLEHGNVEESAYGYVTHAITVGPVRGEYQAAYAWGQLALGVNQRFEDSRLRAKIYQQFHAHVSLWCEPMRTCVAYAREAYRSGLDSGDFLYAAYGAGTEPWTAIVATQDLALFVREYVSSVELIEKLKNTAFADSVRVILNWARALQGRTIDPLSLTDATLDEASYLSTYGNHPIFAGIHAVVHLHLSVLLGTPEQALTAARYSAGLVHSLPGTMWPVIHEFFHGMALAANIAGASDEDRAAWHQQLQQFAANCEARAVHCAENFLCQALLLGAEIAHIEGRDHDASHLFERAIEFAAANTQLQYEALAHELWGQLHLRRGRPSLAALHLARARERYLRWGALAKVDVLDRQYPGLALRQDAPAPSVAGLAESRSETLTLGGSSPADAADDLDLFSVLKATRVIAGHGELAGLLVQLLRIALENAGAERGALVLEGDGGPMVYAAEATDTASSDALACVALAASESVPVGIVNYVRRTGESVVLAQAETDEQYRTDPYISRNQPRSVVCLPVHAHGRTISTLYLEHRHVSGMFTPQRLVTLRILSTQAAVSLENNQLFAGLKQEITEHERAQDRLRTALAEVERLKEDLEAENSYLRRDLIANVSHDLRTPLVSMRGYLEVLQAKGDRLTAKTRQQYLDIAVRQSEHLGSLIDGLFELARLDFKGMTLNREPFSIADLASDVLQKFQLAADETQVVLSLEGLPRLPFVEGDLSLLERVLDNLIGNAMKHTPAGGRVCVHQQVEGAHVVTQIADTGSGIASAELPFVFDRFYRGTNGRTRETGGSGLGLAITKRILDLHEARISVESDGKTGTCFTFSLPIHDAVRTRSAAASRR